MSDIRERKLASSSSPPAHSIKVGEDRRPKSGLLVQILRTLLLAIWFWTCIFCIFVIQLIGCPLYFIRKDYYYAYMALTKKSFGILIITITQWGAPTRIRVSGDKSIRGELHQTKDGHLKTMFPDRLVLIANHQVYTDWLYLWWIAYSARMHGHLFIILKETLKYIPILGQGMMFYGFIFMARKWQSDKPRLEHRLRKLKTQHSRHLSGSQPFDPMWLMIFPEGTNLSANSKEKNDEYGQKQGIPVHRHLLLPRSTGLYFCLQQLRETVDYVYDCTLAYEGPPKGSYPDMYFTLRSTYLQGRPPKSVNMHWRRFAVSDIPLDDQKEFDTWLRARWAEKDDLLEQFYNSGRFPSDLVETGSANGAPSGGRGSTTPVGYIETDLGLRHWIEIGEIFGITPLLHLLL